MRTCTHSVSLGAYVLGALDPADRAEFENHLAECTMCQAELVRLAPLTGLLHQVTPEDFADDPELTADGDPIEPPLPAAAAVPPDRKRRYLIVAAAAVIAAIIAVGGVFGYRALTTPDQAQEASVTWTGQNRSTGMHANAQLVDRSWGTEVRLRLDEVPSDERCKLVVKEKDGTREIAGWWSSTYQVDDLIPGSTSARLSDIANLQVVDANDVVLVDIPAPVS